MQAVSVAPAVQAVLAFHLLASRCSDRMLVAVDRFVFVALAGFVNRT